MATASTTITKLKSFLPFTGNTDNLHHHQKATGQRIQNTLLPEIGFQINLHPGVINDTNINYNDDAINSHCLPELVVRLIGARHLPNKFGIKYVEGYFIRVKIFPGSIRHNSSIQKTSWPKFNENFKFPMETTAKSSFKWKTKKMDSTLPLLDNLFHGHFMVFTAFALFEVPSRTISLSIREKLNRFRRKSFANTNQDVNNEKPDGNSTKDILTVTSSDMKRNLGSVTYFLNPKLFEENPKTRIYETSEMWLPLKDISAPQKSLADTQPTGTKFSPNKSARGQIEIILQLINENEEMDLSSMSNNKKTSSNVDKKTPNWNDMKKLFTLSQKKSTKGLCLKVTTAKMRCSIKAKEEFENYTNMIYIKTSVFEHGILSNAWKSDMFSPSLSVRWNTNQSTLIIPIYQDHELENITIKVSIATKNSAGKKIIFGTVHMSQSQSSEHWQKFQVNRGRPITHWYNFE